MQLWNYTDRFVRERKILNNVSTATADWYHYSLKAFKPVLEAEYQSIPELRTAIITRIGELRGSGRGNKAVSVNTYLRCLKAFLNWCFDEQIVKERVKLSWLKEEEKILAPLRPEHIKRLVDYKPVQRSGMRLRAIVLTALDTGLRPIARSLARGTVFTVAYRDWAAASGCQQASVRTPDGLPVLGQYRDARSAGDIPNLHRIRVPLHDCRGVEPLIGTICGVILIAFAVDCG